MGQVPTPMLDKIYWNTHQLVLYVMPTSSAGTIASATRLALSEYTKYDIDNLKNFFENTSEKGQ